jgi:hypothetical protein
MVEIIYSTYIQLIAWRLHLNKVFLFFLSSLLKSSHTMTGRTTHLHPVPSDFKACALDHFVIMTSFAVQIARLSLCGCHGSTFQYWMLWEQGTTFFHIPLVHGKNNPKLQGNLAIP